MIDLCRKAGIPEPEFEQRGAQFVLTIRRKERPRQEPPTQSADPVIRLLFALQQGELSAGELRATLKIKHRPTFRANYLHPALEARFIKYTIPGKPNSRLQKYRLTPKGAGYLKARGGEKAGTGGKNVERGNAGHNSSRR